jgi:N6-adenosine-specific RNA methylase IME4
MLAEAKTLDEILHVENLAQRARDFAKAAGLGRTAWNQAAVVMLNARRKAGQTLIEMKHRGELAARGANPKKRKSQAGTITIDDLGLTKNQSSRYQKEAKVPQDVFDEWVQRHLDGDDDLTASGLRRMAKQHQAASRQPADELATPELLTGTVANLGDLINDNQRFACIYADPPWQYGNQSTRAATNNHYGTMTVEQICAEPVAFLSDECCHLYLWTTAGFLREAFDVIDAWGFTYKSNMVWVKPQMGIGNYVRLSHEHLLIGIKGKTRTNGKSQISWIEANRTAHSAKPDAFRAAIERMSQGPYLELYGRQQVDGWMVYGNQISRTLLG